MDPTVIIRILDNEPDLLRVVAAGTLVFGKRWFGMARTLGVI